MQSRLHDFTGLEFLDFWMQSIYAYATADQSVQVPTVDRPQLSPPIFIIGTHRESGDISKDPEERKTIVSTETVYIKYCRERMKSFFRLKVKDNIGKPLLKSVFSLRSCGKCSKEGVLI